MDENDENDEDGDEDSDDDEDEDEDGDDDEDEDEDGDDDEDEDEDEDTDNDDLVELRNAGVPASVAERRSVSPEGNNMQHGAHREYHKKLTGLSSHRHPRCFMVLNSRDTSQRNLATGMETSFQTMPSPKNKRAVRTIGLRSVTGFSSNSPSSCT